MDGELIGEPVPGWLVPSGIVVSLGMVLGLFVLPGAVGSVGAVTGAVGSVGAVPGAVRSVGAVLGAVGSVGTVPGAVGSVGAVGSPLGATFSPGVGACAGAELSGTVLSGVLIFCSASSEVGVSWDVVSGEVILPEVAASLSRRCFSAALPSGQAEFSGERSQRIFSASGERPEF